MWRICTRCIILRSWIGSGTGFPSVAYVHAPYPVCPGSAQYLRNEREGLSPYCWRDLPDQCSKREMLLGTPPWQTSAAAAAHTPVQARRTENAADYCGQRVHAGSHGSRRRACRQDRSSGARFSSIDNNSPTPVNQDSATVLYAGRLTVEKGITHLIQALAGTDCTGGY